jgi:hypothetical protein
MPKKGILSFALFFLAVLLIGPSYAEKHTLEGERVIVRYDGLLESAAREVLKAYPGIRADLTRELGWETDFRPEIVLVKDRVAFRKSVESDLVTAFAFPQEDLIVIDYSRMNVHPFTLGATLKHELCHLELHHHIAGGKLPRWFDEGICQWVTGGLAEIMTEGSRSILRDAALSNRLMSIERLAERFPTDGRDLLLAYEESRSIVEYIKKEFGVLGLQRILEQMGRGETLENAVMESLLISPDELERRWRSSLHGSAWWFFSLGDNLYEILFLFAALMTLYGFFRILKKKRAYKDEDEEDREKEER